MIANCVWAMDYAEIILSHDPVILQDSGSSPHSPKSINTCDHCCHGVAHLTGLTAVMTTLIVQPVANRVAPKTNEYFSLPTAPPTPPPDA